jgi:hypothetical protein
MITFKEYINEKKTELIDLQQAIKDNTVQKYWGRGLAYQGKDLLDMYMDSIRDFDDEMAEKAQENADVTDFSGQEVYLGYDKKKDTFISGWDCSFTEKIENPEFDLNDEDSYEDEYVYEESSTNVMVEFKLIKGKSKIIDINIGGDGIFYNNKGEGYDVLKKNKNIVDIRLD